ncbi:hypothetical protein TorRG33x02_340490 [Trema orientale]|uniref:Uncharacterized protein n=1 Tax=Trema orientale TaxID=63057 RepID=A0A2P5AUW7_TREOI|nr:hypothetical protein TorRG33x02_340490 [Trema orientale]
MIVPQIYSLIFSEFVKLDLQLSGEQETVLVIPPILQLGDFARRFGLVEWTHLNSNSFVRSRSTGSNSQFDDKVMIITLDTKVSCLLVPMKQI